MNPPPDQRVLRVLLPVPLPQPFDYLPPGDTPPIPRGARVLVTFGRRRLVGVVAGEATGSAVEPGRLLRIEQALDDCEPLLSTELMDLLEWCAAYYKHPPGEVVFNALPPLLRRSSGMLPQAAQAYALTAEGSARLREPAGRARQQHALLGHLEGGPATGESLRSWNPGWRRLLARVMEQGWVEQRPLQWPGIFPRPGPELTGEQALVLDTVRASLGAFRCHLLDGITGSGKTEIYLRLVEEVLAAGRQALVLVPEIGLTPQLVRRFTERLGLEPAVYHSGLPGGQRLAAWAAARRGQARLLLGTRSALFLPLTDPGLIIMDESHDASFKQQDGFRFSARDVAVKRAAGIGVPIVLGTATPSLESLHNAQTGRYGWSRLRRRATGAREPAWRVADLRGQRTEGGLLGPVLQSIGETIGRGEQALVFLNRRGYAPVLLCHDCGWHATCGRCDANLTWHRGIRALVCHHCDSRQAVPGLCPECGANDLQGAGEGTQQLEHLLAEKFPGVPLYRFDRDQVSRRGAFEDLYESVRRGGPCLLVGTQMLAKGHHFPLVTRVVIVNVDQALYSGDFRALERLGQLVMQVAGRAGRAERAGEVVLQTHHPDNALLATLFTHGYEAFARALLEERALARLPPYAFQATLRAEAAARERVLGFLESARACFPAKGCELHGPFPAQMEKKGGRLRWYLLAQAGRRPALQSALDAWLPRVRSLRQARSVRWSLDVDPQEF